MESFALPKMAVAFHQHHASFHHHRALETRSLAETLSKMPSHTVLLPPLQASTQSRAFRRPEMEHARSFVLPHRRERIAAFQTHAQGELLLRRQQQRPHPYHLHQHQHQHPLQIEQSKSSLGFILSGAEAEEDADLDECAARPAMPVSPPMLPATTSLPMTRDQPTSRYLPVQVKQEPAADKKKKKKRKARICTAEGCTKYVVDHGLCIRHGGGKRCYIDGCDCRAQNRGLCWKHGGFTICKVENCTKRAKSRGICWSHGGGTRCKHEDCTKIAVSLGRCWAHGGGKRCALEGCQKPASERTNNLCNEHFAHAHRLTPQVQ